MDEAEAQANGRKIACEILRKDLEQGWRRIYRRYGLRRPNRSATVTESTHSPMEDPDNGNREC